MTQQQPLPGESVVAWTGPYRASLEYLEGRSSEDPPLSSAVSFMMVDWADSLIKRAVK